MAQTASALFMLINPLHTAGQDLASDIVLPEDLLEPLCHAINDDDQWASFWGDDDEDDNSRDSMAMWVWRKPRLRKG